MIRRCLLGVCVLAVALSSCKSSRVAEKGTVDTIPESGKKLLSLLDKADFQFETLEIKGRGHFADKDSKQSFTYKLRMRKDEEVWLSVTVLGFEGLRLLATPEEVQVLNRLNNEHIIADYSWLSSRVGLAVDFTMLQQLLLGNQPLPPKAISQIDTKSTPAQLISETPKAQARIVINSSEMRPGQITGVLTESGQKSTLTYQQYQALTTGRLPFFLNLQVEGSDPLSLELQHKGAVLNLSKMPTVFRVPDAYTVIRPK